MPLAFYFVVGHCKAQAAQFYTHAYEQKNIYPLSMHLHNSRTEKKLSDLQKNSSQNFLDRFFSDPTTLPYSFKSKQIFV
jgi:hypothetical protein